MLMLYCKTLIFGGYFYLALFVVKTKIAKISIPRNTVSHLVAQAINSMLVSVSSKQQLLKNMFCFNIEETTP